MRVRDDIINRCALPSDIYEKEADRLLLEQINKSNKKIVVVDDDPTGVQTVHDISVYTDWKLESMLQAFEEKKNIFYILSNSRGLTREETVRVHTEIAEAVDKASKQCNQDYFIISRSDSTLRGHYPVETQVLKKVYEARNQCVIHGEILCPFFKEGGRFTIDNIHFVKYGTELVSANETEYAKDKTFGYQADTLPGYIQEKTEGEFKARDVVCITLEDIRSFNIEKIERQLLEIENFNKVVVNAADDIDLKIFCIALYRAMEAGKRFMFRTAAAFVKAAAGISGKELLSREEMIRVSDRNGGLIIVGSHTNKTTAQLTRLRELPGIVFIELDVTDTMDTESLESNLRKCIEIEETNLVNGTTVCCYTTRTEQAANTGNKEDELRLSVRISLAVQRLVSELSVIPSFIVAKGGITSSDIGTKALKVKRAQVIGQIAPGIPVWRTGSESKFPQIPYIIFPGNVGDDDTLFNVARILIK